MKIYLVVFDDNILSHDQAFQSEDEAKLCLKDYIDCDKEAALSRGVSEEDYVSYHSILELEVV